MTDVFTMKPIAYIHTDFPTKFGIPRQSGYVPDWKNSKGKSALSFPNSPKRSVS